MTFRLRCLNTASTRASLNSISSCLLVMYCICSIRHCFVAQSISTLCSLVSHSIQCTSTVCLLIVRCELIHIQTISSMRSNPRHPRHPHPQSIICELSNPNACKNKLTFSSFSARTRSSETHPFVALATFSSTLSRNSATSCCCCCISAFTANAAQNCHTGSSATSGPSGRCGFAPNAWAAAYRVEGKRDTRCWASERKRVLNTFCLG